MVEAALITPIFLLVLFGVLEFGYSFLDRLSVKNASLTGARVGSSEGTNALADFTVLEAIDKALSGLSPSKVTTIVIYKATSYTASVPAACLTGSVTDLCNHYTGTDLSAPDTQFGCEPGNKDEAWCPTDRKTAQFGVNGPPDYFGVYVVAHHQNLTGFFGKGYDFKADTVIRLEPRRLV